MSTRRPARARVVTQPNICSREYSLAEVEHVGCGVAGFDVVQRCRQSLREWHWPRSTPWDNSGNFEHILGVQNQSERSNRVGRLMDDPPDHFVCPITRDVMADPVLLVTNAGRSYERRALQEFLAQQPRRDPATNVVHERALRCVPNRSLKEAIEEWRGQKKVVEAPRWSQALNVTLRRGSFALTATARVLEPALKASARMASRGLCVVLRRFWQHAAVASARIRGVDALVRLVRLGRHRERELAAKALAERAFEDNGGDMAGAVRPLVELLATGNVKGKEHAASALWGLALSAANRALIARAGAVRELVLLADVGSDGAQESAAAALFLLSLEDDIREEIAQADAIKPLVAILDSSDVGAQEQAAWALSSLASVVARDAAALANARPALDELARCGRTKGARDAAQNALDRLHRRSKVDNHPPRVLKKKTIVW